MVDAGPKIVQMRCPRDRTPLELKERNELRISLCADCGGFFVDLRQAKASQLKAFISDRFSEALLPSETWQLQSPAASTAMKRLNISDVELDYCEQSHSVWFDSSEFSVISEKVAQWRRPQPIKQDVTGGVERAGRDDSSDVFGFLQMFYEDNDSSGSDFFDGFF